MRQLMQRRLSLIALGVLAVVTAVLVAIVLTRPAVETRAVPSTPSPVATTQAATDTPAPAPPAETPSPTASATATDDAATTAVFLGDGYTAGAQWPELAGEAAGWQVVNLAQAGQGYRVAPSSCTVTPCTPFGGMVAQVAERKPDVVVLAGGDADGDYALAAVTTKTLTDLRAALPDAEIFVLSPLSARSPQPYWLTMHAESLRAAAASADATFVDVSAVAKASASYANGALTPEAGAQVAALLVAADE